MNELSLQEKLEKIYRECPLVPHTGAGQLFSTVRRMKAEKEMDIPINFRSGFAISTKLRKPANEMVEQEWEGFYSDLSESLKKDYPELYTKVFTKKSKDSED